MIRSLFFWVLLSVGNCYTTNKEAVVRTNTLVEDKVDVSEQKIQKTRAISSLARLMKVQMNQVMRNGTDLYDICHHMDKIPTPVPPPPPGVMAKLKIKVKEITGDEFWKGVNVLYWMATTAATVEIANIGINTAMMDQEGSSSVFTPANVQCYDELKDTLMWVQNINLETYEDPCSSTDIDDCDGVFSPLRTLAVCIMDDMNIVIQRQRDANIKMELIAAIQTLAGHAATHAAVDTSANSIQKDLDGDGIEDDAVELQFVKYSCELETSMEKVKESFSTHYDELLKIPGERPHYDRGNALIGFESELNRL